MPKRAMPGMVLILFCANIFQPACVVAQHEAHQYETVELSFESNLTYANPYTDADVQVRFINDSKDTLWRPAFWDGMKTWKVRFASPETNGKWTWTTFCSDSTNKGLHMRPGRIAVTGATSANLPAANGTLKMSPGKRNLVFASGKPFLMVANTLWASPFRATTAQIEMAASHLQAEGFNTVLLAVIQTDINATGPDERNVEQGFKRAFNDLPSKHLNEINVSYFRYLDEIIRIYRSHGLVPVFAPLLHGYGWKGKQSIGNSVQPAEYVRYMKYLLGRYGSEAAMWLLSVDGGGYGPGIEDCGKMLEAMDCYHQPTGLHYSPCDDYIAGWAKDLLNKEFYCLHENKTHQDATWLNFQWAQTGHDGKHLYHKVNKMYDNLPVKAVADGESTYEGMNGAKAGLGWWQGEDAWNQLLHGGTMGVVYGAAGLWQWKITPGETGWETWTDQPKNWETAMDMEGSKYVGLIAKILQPYSLTDIERRWNIVKNNPVLTNGKLWICFLPAGGKIRFKKAMHHIHAKWIDPKTGNEINGEKPGQRIFRVAKGEPAVLIITKE